MGDSASDVIRIPDSMLGLIKTLGKVPSAEEALWLFCTPVRVEMARKEALAAESAQRFEFQSGEATLAGYEWGEGDKSVLLMHGWNGRGTNLSSFVEPLVGAGYKVVAFDAHGHGDSGGQYCYAPLMAGAAIDLARERGDFYGVVAHSFGTCATNVAQKLGLNVERVAYMSTMCWIKQRFFEFSTAVGLDAAGQEEMWQISESFFGPGRIESFHGDVACSEFTSRGLLVHDEDDPEISADQSRAMAAVWRDSELWVTKGLGHFRIVRSPLVVNRVVEFMNDEV
jgi:pimeloyl-ACP methyl ester carboxylesterase